MHWDLGLRGLEMLVFLSVSFGVVAELIGGRTTTRWPWLIASITYFVSGLLASEIWFGSAGKNAKDTFDGLSFEEGLLVALICGVVSILVTWYVTRRRRSSSSPTAAATGADRPWGRLAGDRSVRSRPSGDA